MRKSRLQKEQIVANMKISVVVKSSGCLRLCCCPGRSLFNIGQGRQAIRVFVRVIRLYFSTSLPNSKHMAPSISAGRS